MQPDARFCLTIGRYLAQIRHESSYFVPSPIPYVVADQLPVAVEHSETSLNPILRVFQLILRCEKHVGRGLRIIGATRCPLLPKNRSIFGPHSAGVPERSEPNSVCHG